MIRDYLSPLEDELIGFRRDVHRHPELSHEEFRTTERIAARLASEGLEPVRFERTGLRCDIGTGPLVAALRADIDALPIDDLTDTDYASQEPGRSHSCGHDVHLTALLGAALVLARMDHSLPGGLGARIRVIFQPAEEITPGGALDVIRQGALEGVPRIFALHCDPKVDVGRIGSRIGAITAAGDTVSITVTGRGGHTSRPHLTEDLVYALGHIATQLPAALGRRIDPRHSVSLVWGVISAGHAPNVVPNEGILQGTLRCLDVQGWHQAGELLPDIVDSIASPYGVQVRLDHRRGVPPVVNTEPEVTLIEEAVRAELGPGCVELTPQSMGGEDFAWYVTHVPGAMVRMGTRTPGGRSFDLHQGDYLVDERAVGVGARIFAATALAAVADHAALPREETSHRAASS